MSNNELMTQGQFADFWGVSQPMISRYIRQGKIPPACLVMDGKYQKIRVECAVRALEENLHPLKRKSRQPEPDPEPFDVEEYESFLNFDPHDYGDLGAYLALALDICSVISESLKPDAQKRMERSLEDISHIFGCCRVRVEGLTGKRCIPVDRGQ